MSFHKEDGVSSLCQKALHIVTELCFAGQVEWEKCSSIFPPDGGSQGGSNTGNWGGLRSRPRSSRGLALSVLSSWVLRLPRGAGASLGRLAFLSYPSPLVSSWRLSVWTVQILSSCLHLSGFFRFSGPLRTRCRRFSLLGSCTLFL